MARTNHVQPSKLKYFTIFLLTLVTTSPPEALASESTITERNAATAAVAAAAVSSPQIGNRDVLEPNYDNVEQKIKIFDERLEMPLVLSCNISVEGRFKLIWAKDGKDVGLISKLKGRYQIIDEENKFIIRRPEEDDAGEYSCSIADQLVPQTKVFNVVANVYFKRLPASTAVVETEKLIIHCRAYGTNPKIQWTVGNKTYTESEDRIILKEDEFGIENSILIIEQAQLDDQGFFNCSGTNDGTIYGNYEEAVTYTHVRVKGKLAALWPFIGICTEVFVLCAIILIYEKKRHRSVLDDSDSDHEQDKLKATKK